MTRRPRCSLVAALAVGLGLGPAACTEAESGGSETDDTETSAEATTETATSAATEATSTTTDASTATSTSTSTPSSTGTGATSTTSTTSTSSGTDVTSDTDITSDTDVTSGTDVTTTTGPSCPPDGPSFAAEVFPIIAARCSCHKVSYPDADTAYAALVDAPSLGVPGLTLVEPCDIDGSYLLNKLRDTQLEVGGLGTQMPPDKALSPAQLDLFDAWVAGGAPP